MTGKELFEIWAPRESIWSPWVSPVLFAQIECREAALAADPFGPAPIWHESAASPDTAVIVDLPGAGSIRLAISLAEHGYRPVPVINASPGPFVPNSTLIPQSMVTLDMNSLVKEICIGTRRLQRLSLPPDAPPVFILDALRLKGTKPPSDYMFDNRWRVFPQDFPSARFFAEQKIKRVTLVQPEKTAPLEDLSHVLLRWQEAGIEILSKAVEDPGPPSAITVSRPSRFRALWYRALAIMGLRRNNVGGFGSLVPASGGAG